MFLRRMSERVWQKKQGRRDQSVEENWLLWRLKWMIDYAIQKDLDGTKDTHISRGVENNGGGWLDE